MLVSATGPVWRYGEDAKKAARMGGRMDAYKPYTGGIPASSA
jgi:hypothetical protein